MEQLKKYFPNLTALQIKQYSELIELYKDWNNKINLISRKDIDNIDTHHVLHSLAIAAFYPFKPGLSIMDVGTGGGFPGLPLAIMYPQCNFYLIDSIGKKINVVNDIVRSLSLKNVIAEQVRAEQINKKFDFIVSRAVTQLPVFIDWTYKNLKKGKNKGILYLKGGDVSNELATLKLPYTLFKIQDKFEEPFFETKLLAHIYLK